MAQDFPTIKLQRQYKFGEKQQWLIEPIGEDLWIFIESRIGSVINIPLRDNEEFTEVIHSRMVGYVVARLIAASKIIAKGFPMDELSGAMERRLSDEIDDMLERVTLFSEADRNRTTDLLVGIMRRFFEETGEVTPAQGNAIKKVAFENAHKCYLCATRLEYGFYKVDDSLNTAAEESAKFEHKRRSYELEHIYPTSKGGGRARRNLAACCNECNKFKADLSTFSEVAIESMIVASTDPLHVKSTFGRRQRFAILWRQQGRCRSCDTPFFDADDDRLFLVREDESDAYHFLNVRIVCGACADASENKGIKVRGQ